MPRQYPDWIEAYLRYAQHSEAPDRFHFWTGVSVISGALRRKVWISQGYFSWIPNFYIFFVAPPGIVAKSTTADIGMRLLRSVKGIKFGPDAITWQSLIQELANSGETFEYDDLSYPMSAITIVASELGTFFNPNDRDMVNALVALWDSREEVFRKVTKTSGRDEVVNPWINIIGCTTPSWIADSFPEYMIGGGFVSRSIFVYAEEKRKLVAYPIDHFSEVERELEARLKLDLEHIATNIAGPFRLSAEAHTWGEAWYIANYERNRDTLATDRFANSLARKQTQLHKLGMILSVSRSDSRILEKADLERAALHLDEIEAGMAKVFSKINAPEARATNALIDYVERVRKVSKPGAFKALIHTMSLEQFTAAVEGGIQSGHFKLKQESGTIYLVSSDYERSVNGA